MNNDKRDQNMEKLLREALRPELSPSAELNERILSGDTVVDTKKQKDGIRKWYILPKAAVAAAAIVLVSSAGVYAATRLLSDPVVTDHSISVGNTEYVDDDAIMATEEPPTITNISSEKGDENVKWLTKDVEIVNGYTNTRYTYATYEEAAAEAGMDQWLSSEYYVTEESAGFTDIEGDGYHSKEVYADFRVITGIEGDGYHNKEVDADFRVKEGRIHINESLADAGVAEDAAYSILLQHPSNERTYTAENGLQYKLIDDVAGEEQSTITYVMIAYDKYTGYLSFEGMTDEEIHEVLEDVKLSGLR